MSRRRQLEPCLKKRYPSERIAQQALADIREAATKEPPHRIPSRVYKCLACNGHHLTSQAIFRATDPEAR